MAQSLKAIKIDGVISIIGFLGADTKEPQPGFLDALMNICTVRGILVGNRVQFEEMVSSVFRFSKGWNGNEANESRIERLRRIRLSRWLTRRCSRWRKRKSMFCLTGNHRASANLL